MSLVPISPLKDFLTGTIWDKFKELIEPYALVNAIVFIILNLILVFPATGVWGTDTIIGELTTTSDASAPNATSLDVWRLLLMTITVFVFSYFINHLSTFFLNFASGEIFRGSPFIGKRLKTRQEERFTILTNDSGSTNDDTRRNRAIFRLAYEFPVTKAELGLTRLGNHLLSPASYASHQYGANLQIVWPILQEKIPDDNKTLKSVQGNWVSLLFFTSLYGLLFVLALELSLVVTFGGRGSIFWQIILLLGFAALCYHASLEKARQWGIGLRHLFDAHLKEVFADLGMESLKALTPASTEYRSSWKDVMRWLAYGAIRQQYVSPQEKWYKADPASETWPKLKYPEFLKVESIPRFVSKEMYSRSAGNRRSKYEYTCIEKSVEYWFAITNTSTGKNPLSGQEAYLLIQDQDVSPPPIVSGHLSKLIDGNTSPAFDSMDVTGKRQQSEPAGLLFPLGNLPPGHSRVLTYSFDSVLAHVTSSFKIAQIEFPDDDAELLMDLVPAQAQQAADVELEIKVLDDAQTKLNSRIVPYNGSGEVAGETVKGEMLEEKRIGMWKFNLEPKKIGRIRVTLIRNE